MRDFRDELQFFRDFRKLNGTERSLVNYIRGYTPLIFGEKITWHENRVSNADLEGTDSENNIVIVKVKRWNVNDRSNMSVQEHTSVRQIIKYTSNHTFNFNLNSMRLFIVGSVKSHNLENTCNFLRNQGLNINYVSVSDIVYSELARVIDDADDKEV